MVSEVENACFLSGAIDGAEHGQEDRQGWQSLELEIHPKHRNSPRRPSRKKSELFALIAEHVGTITKKQVSSVFETLGKVIATDLAKPSPDKPKVFVVPGMMKISAIHKPPPARPSPTPSSRAR